MCIVGSRRAAPYTEPIMKFHTQIAVFLLLCAGGAERAWPDVVMPIESVASFVNIRMAPDATSEVVGQLQQGSQLRYVRTVDGWYEVELEGGGTGFVSVDWTRLVADDDRHVAAATTDQSAPAEAMEEPASVAEPVGPHIRALTGRRPPPPGARRRSPCRRSRDPA